MLLASSLACALMCVAHAQTTAQDARRDAKQQGAQKKADKNAEAGAARARREVTQAVAALQESAELARAFDDVYESVRTQAEAADALWPFDQQAARSILRRAWEAANAPGAEDHVEGFGTSEDPREDALDALTTARGYVVKTALRHDTRMADALMREFERELVKRSTDAETQAEKTPAQPDARSDDAASNGRERTLSRAGWQRLFIARQLVEEGDFKHAAEAVAPLVAEGPSLPLLKFILDLRARDERDADALYLRLLERTLGDASADANDVLLLSTPIISPELCVSIGADGSADFTTLHYENEEAKLAAQALPARARLAFYSAAAAMLLRTHAQRGGKDSGSDEAAALYFAVGRLLPFFEHEAAQFAPALNARLVSLAAEIEAGRRESLKTKMDVSDLAPKNPVDPLAFPLEEVSRASDSAGRDFARLSVVARAARLGLWERARSFTEQIEDAQARRAARLVVAIRQVANISRSFDDEEPDAFERAASFVRAADVPTEVRALGLAQAAEMAAHTKHRVRADALFAEAASAAAGADRGAQRTAALALVTLSAARSGGVRLWELLPAFVRAAGETEGLRYGEMLLEFNVNAFDRSLWVSAPDAPVSLGEVFAEAARLDSARTLAEARAFKDEEMRAVALLASARAVLEKNALAVGAHAR
ncbi:MAG: hypothetical protein QOJ70_3651 [Acidobacteriota bacterium]|jgi:hypothetical protein|nr:hypothetical protein [Acidobacteriota bacterium]